MKTEPQQYEQKITFRCDHQSKWYGKTWLIIVLCIILSPIRLYAQEQNSNSEVTPPDIKVGDVFIIESINPAHPENNAKTERTVVSTDGGIIVLSVVNLNSKSGKKRSLKFNKEWNLIATRNSDNSGFDYSPPLKYFEFPLSPGKTWQQTTTETNIKTDAIRKHKISAVVGDWEDITVPAGTFHAIKVSLNTEVVNPITGEKSTGTDTSWYAPDVKRTIKSEVTSRNETDKTEQQSVAQLISFNGDKTKSANEDNSSSTSSSSRQKEGEGKDIEGAISNYQCSDDSGMCYLTIIDNKGIEHSALCPTDFCGNLNENPETNFGGYKGKAVKVTIGKVGEKNDQEDAFLKIQLIMNASTDNTSPTSSSEQTEQKSEGSTGIGIGQVLHTEYFDVTVNKVSLNDRVDTNTDPLLELKRFNAFWSSDSSDRSVYQFSGLKPEQGNKFLIINVSFKNIDTESRLPDDGSVWINYNGKEYEYDKSETVEAEGWGISFLTNQLNPLTTLTTKLVYKIPAEIKGPAYWQPGRSSKDKRIFLGNL